MDVGYFAPGEAPTGFHSVRASVEDVSTGEAISDAVVEVNGLRLTYNSIHRQYEGALDVLSTEEVAFVEARINANGEELSGSVQGNVGTCAIDAPRVLHRGFPAVIRWSWSNPAPRLTGMALVDPADINGPFISPAADPRKPSVEDSFQDSEGYADGYLPQTDAHANLLVPSRAPDPVLLVVEGGIAANDLGDGSSELGIAKLCAQEIRLSTATLVSVTVEGPTAAVDPTGLVPYSTDPLQFRATGHFDDGNDQDFTESAAWSAGPDQVVQFAPLAQSGAFTILGQGTTQITASYGGISGSSPLVVRAPQLQSIAIVSQDLASGQTPVYPGQLQVQYGVNAFYDVGSRNVRLEASWSSSNPAVASVVPGGLVTTTGPGSVDILASFAGKNASSTLEVLDWTWRPTNVREPLSDLVWTGEQFVAIGNTVAIRSPDGVQWTQQDLLPGNESAAISSLIWTGTQLVAVGGQDILTSPDGVTWTSRPLPARTDGVPYELRSIAASPSRLMAAGTGVVLTSTDGAIWTIAVTWLAATKVLWFGSSFLVIDPTLLAVSPDGHSWQTGDNPGLSAVTVMGSTVVNIGDGQLSRSTDGLSWTFVPIDPTVDPRGLVWTGTELLGQDASFTLFSSPDGMSWTRQPFSRGVVATASSPDRQVVLLYDGSVMTRP